MSESDCYDVFLSYHGGQEDSTNSSYPKALEIKQFLESRGLSVFLCKDRNSSDFYTEIDNALRKSKHFILVACNRDSLSNWIYDEIKTFDGLQKSGFKPNSVLNAYIFGDLTEKELIEFNSLFVSKDIKKGENGINELYEEIKRKTDGKGEITVMDRDIRDFRFLDLVNLEIVKDFSNDISNLAGNDDRKVWSVYLVELFEIYRLASLKDYICEVDKKTDVLVVRLQRHYSADEIREILGSDFRPELDFLILSAVEKDGKPDILADFVHNTYTEIRSDFQIKYGNAVFSFDDDSEFSEDFVPTVHLSYNGADIKMEVADQYEDEVIPVTHIEFDGKANNSKEYIRLQKYDLLSRMVHAFGEKLANLFKTTFDIDYLNSIYLDYDRTVNVHPDITRINRVLLKDEFTLAEFYISYKRKGVFDSQLFNILEKGYYATIAQKIKEYCNNNKVEALEEALALLDFKRNEEMSNGSHYIPEFILLLMTALTVHNVFVFNENVLNKYHIYSEMQKLEKFELMEQNSIIISSWIRSLEKELLFANELSNFENPITAYDWVLGQFNALIDRIKAIPDYDKNENYTSCLFMLYRQRGVISEALGDECTDQAKRIKHYTDWKEDSKEAIDLGRSFDSDRELLGCSYLNYASSLNKLSRFQGEEAKKEYYETSLDNLNSAFEVLVGSTAQRYTGYVHLHRCDCYSEMFDSGLYDGPTCVSKMYSEAVKAYRIFRGLTDHFALGWCLRILAKSTIYKDGGNVEQKIVEGFNKLNQALDVDTKHSNVKEIACCMHDFESYIKLIDRSEISPSMEEQIKNIFKKELEAFTSVIERMEFNYDDILSLQKPLLEIAKRFLE